MGKGVILLAFDFDGTLAPIDVDPAAVAMDEETEEFLHEAAATSNVVVAVISGRDAEDLAARAAELPAFLVASHGLEIRDPGGRIVRTAPPLDLPLDEELEAEIRRHRLRIEKKKHALALHWRGVGGVDALHPVVDAFRIWALSQNLLLIEGRCVVEARLQGAGKEEALRWLASATAASHVIYAGDDTTDLGPLRYAAEHGRALFMSSSERTPPAGVTVIGSRDHLLEIIREEIRI